MKVGTTIHNPHEYAVGFDILELKLNEDWTPTVSLDPKTYSVGGTLSLTD